MPDSLNNGNQLNFGFGDLILASTVGDDIHKELTKISRSNINCTPCRVQSGLIYMQLEVKRVLDRSGLRMSPSLELIIAPVSL